MGEHQRIPVIIICRMGSSRLPGKTLMPFGDSNLLNYQIKRIKKYVPNAHVIVATSSLKEDDSISKYCEEIGVNVARGNPISVCKRLLSTMNSFDLLNTIVVLGDNPWLEANLASKLFDKLLQAPDNFWVTPTPEIGSGKTAKMLPTGTRLQAVNKNFLQTAVSLLSSDEAGEHLAIVLKQNSPNNTESILEIDYGYDFHTASLYNISINTRDDYALARKVLGTTISSDIKTIYDKYLKINEI